MDNKKYPIRQCISCRKQLLRENFVRLTKTHDPISGSEKIVINPNSFQLGRSVYLCKSTSCINIAIKEKKIAKMLRVSVKSIQDIVSELETKTLKEEVQV